MTIGSVYSKGVVGVEWNLYRSLLTKIVKREGIKGGIVGLSEILKDILGRLVRELTGQRKDVGLVHVRGCRGMFLQAKEALGLLVENEPEGQGGSDRKLKELLRRLEFELGQVCRYGSAGRQQQELYRGEIKSALHRLLDTVKSIVAVD